MFKNKLVFVQLMDHLQLPIFHKCVRDTLNRAKPFFYVLWVGKQYQIAQQALRIHTDTVYDHIPGIA